MGDTLIDRLSAPDGLQGAAATLRDWAMQTVFVPATAIQLGVVVAVLAFAMLVSRPLHNGLDRLSEHRLFVGRPAVVLPVIADQATAILALLIAWIAAEAAERAGWPSRVLDIAVSLLAAWVAIRIAARLIRNRAAARAVATVAWTLAALDILGLLDPTAELLDGVALTLGDTRLSALTVVKGVILIVALVWAAVVASNLIERRIDVSADLTPSVKVLLGKLVRIVLLVVAVLAGVGGVGIDLTALAVFTGALGFGIGFGLQKVVSNLVSGLILLMDKSVKPGDVIAVSGTYGWVGSMSARYVSLVTRDGIEHLVPNEELITTRVENWSYSNELLRVSVDYGVSYNADPRKAIAIGLEAASELDRVLKDPKPVCMLKAFGDSSVDLQLRFWIGDPKNGISNVKGQALLLIWDKLHEQGIEIPFPQRDLHIRSAAPIAVAAAEAAPGKKAE
jgi:small-conductance mechanosensitive channel